MPKEAVKDRESMQALLDEELKKLQTDHIDFYLMHGINREKWEYFKSIGAREFFDDNLRIFDTVEAGIMRKMPARTGVWRAVHVKEHVRSISPLSKSSRRHGVN